LSKGLVKKKCLITQQIDGYKGTSNWKPHAKSQNMTVTAVNRNRLDAILDLKSAGKQMSVNDARTITGATSASASRVGHYGAIQMLYYYYLLLTSESMQLL